MEESFGSRKFFRFKRGLSKEDKDLRSATKQEQDKEDKEKRERAKPKPKKFTISTEKKKEPASEKKEEAQ